ncbi:MAG: hypothetical protein U1F43_26620 [Myxococcota bacterium]
MKRLMFGLVALSLSVPAAACGKKEAPAAKPAESQPAETPKPADKPAEAKPAEAKPAEAKPAEEKPAEAKPAEELPPAKGAWKDIPNANGMIADVPANAVENGVGGAAGFHSADGTFEFMVRELSGEETTKSFDQAKADASSMMFKKWIKSETTPDGWVLSYEMPKLDEDAKEVGSVFAFDVRRKIGAKLYSCSGGLSAAEGLDAAIAACNSVRRK